MSRVEVVKIKQSYRTIVLWVVLIVAFFVMYQFLQSSNKDDGVDFSEFIKNVDDKEVKEVTVQGMDIEGQLRNGTKFTTTGRFNDMEKYLIKEGEVEVVKVVKPDENTFWISIIGTWLPMIFLFLIFFLFMRQLQAGGGKAMSFGKSKHRILTEHQQKATFRDIAGIDEAKEELEEIIQFLKDPKRFTRLGGRIPKGVLLMGPPGTGKTLLARAVAGEANVPFFSISGSDFVEMFVGVGASRVRDLFEQGKKHAPCIIFIDELDAVGRHRGAGLGGGHDEREQTLNQLLVEMDGFESNEGVIMISATNRPDVLDPALLRPGRFDRRVVVSRPDIKGREGILKVHARRTPLHKDVELAVIARGTPGFSGADLENLVNEAALLAARKGGDCVMMDDLELAKDKVLMGSERKSMIVSDREKALTAYHEAGHALVAKMRPGADTVHKVTIIPRGRALGLTQQLPSEDRHNLTKEYAENQIAILMGGRLAEEMIFNVQTTGAGHDFETATELARKMTCEWGMSNMGPLTFGKREEQIFLGKELVRHQDYSEATAVQIDSEVKRIVMESNAKARQILEDNRETVVALAEALLEFETLGGEELDLVIKGVDLREHRKVAAAAQGHSTDSAGEAEAQEKTDEEEKTDQVGPMLPEALSKLKQPT